MRLGRRSDAFHWDSKTEHWRKESSSRFSELGGLGTVGSPDWNWKGEQDSRDGRTMRWVWKMTAEG
jgi:hypothetical protein